MLIEKIFKANKQNKAMNTGCLVTPPHPELLLND